MISTLYDELNEVWPKALTSRMRFLIRLASFVLFFVGGIPLVMGVSVHADNKYTEIQYSQSRTQPLHNNTHLL